MFKRPEPPLIEKFFKHEPPLWVYVVVFIVSGVTIGSFGTWKDERVSAAIDHTDSANRLADMKAQRDALQAKIDGGPSAWIQFVKLKKFPNDRLGLLVLMTVNSNEQSTFSDFETSVSFQGPSYVGMDKVIENNFIYTALCGNQCYAFTNADNLNDRPSSPGRLVKGFVITSFKDISYSQSIKGGLGPITVTFRDSLGRKLVARPYVLTNQRYPLTDPAIGSVLKAKECLARASVHNAPQNP